MLKGALAGALNDWSIGERVAEGNAEFDDACSCFNGRENHIAGGCEVGIAAGYVSDERRLRFEVEGHRSIVDCGLISSWGVDDVEVIIGSLGELYSGNVY